LDDGKSSNYYHVEVNMAEALSHGSAAVGRFLRKELVAAWPVFLFFLTGFLLLILLVRLALGNFSIDITLKTTFANAIVGALLAAKAALVLDETTLAQRLEHFRRICAIAVKTLLYGLVCLLLGYFERFLEALRKVHGFERAILYVFAHANHYRLLAWILGITIVFGLYFSFFEINERMGEGSLAKLFFGSPPNRQPLA
jgi:hypothetical protein